MTRRRSLPWIYRWSRPLIGGISIVGLIITAYLTIEKLGGKEVACPIDAAQAAGCGDVLNSPYATIFGLPLSLFGCLAYAAMAIFALSPLFINGEGQKSFRKSLENTTWLLLLAGSTAMTVFSGYLMYILFTQLKSFCPYCITSAIFSTSLLLLTLFGREWEELGQLLFTCVVTAMITLVGTLGVYANVNSPVVQGGREVIPLVTTDAQPPKDGKLQRLQEKQKRL